MDRPQPPTLRERKRRHTRDRIEQAALSLFESRGFDETTVDDIAAAADVSRASVFRYFGSKDDIVYGPESELLDVLRGILREQPHLTLDEVMVRYAEHVDAERPDLHGRGAIIVRTPKLVERFAHVRSRWELAVAEELARRRRPGAPRTFDDRVAAAASVSTLFVAFLDWATDDGGSLADLVRRGIAIAPSPAST